jgi:adenylate cyclase
VVTRILDVPSQSVEDIVIIDIDGRSESELGRFRQWPRTYYPRVIEFVNEGGALAVGLDIIFPKDIREPEKDQEFVASVKEAGNVFNALYFEKADSLNWRYKMNSEPDEFQWEKFAYEISPDIAQYFRQEDRIGNDFFDLLNASHALGHVNFEGEVDGVVRKIFLFSSFNDHSYPSFAFKMYLDLMGVDSFAVDLGYEVKLYSEGNLIQEIPLDDQGNMIINYAGVFKTFRYISFYDVLEQRLPKEYFANKVVLIGTSLPGLYDLRSAPFSPSFPGVEIHANILHTLRTGGFITQLRDIETFALYAGIGILIAIITVFLSPIWSIIVIILCAASSLNYSIDFQCRLPVQIYHRRER